MPEKFKLPKLISDLPDFESLSARAKLDPIGLVEHCRRRSKEYNEGVRWMHWCILVSLYAAARVIEKDQLLIDKLLQLPCFSDQPYQRNSKNVLRLVLLAGLKAPSNGKMYKKVCHEASLLKPFFEDEIDPDALLSMIITSRGLKGLAEHFPARVTEKGHQDEQDDSSTKILTIAHNAKRADPSEQVKNTATVTKIEPSIRSTPPDEEMYLIEVLMTRKRLDRLVNAAEGSKGTIFFEKHEGDPEARMLMATSVVIH